MQKQGHAIRGSRVPEQEALLTSVVTSGTPVVSGTASRHLSGGMWRAGCHVMIKWVFKWRQRGRMALMWWLRRCIMYVDVYVYIFPFSFCLFGYVVNMMGLLFMWWQFGKVLCGEYAGVYEAGVWMSVYIIHFLFICLVGMLSLGFMWWLRGNLVVMW